MGKEKKEEPGAVNEPEELKETEVPESETGRIPSGVPKEFKKDGIKTTKVTRLKDLIKEKLEGLKDMGSLQLLLPVDVRMKKRLEAIRKSGTAESFKVAGHWTTIAPEIHIRGLGGIKHNQGEAEIRFSVYETDENGDKKLYEHYVEMENRHGEMIRRVHSAEYRVAYEVVERILFRKPITREIIRMEEVKQ